MSATGPIYIDLPNDGKSYTIKNTGRDVVIVRLGDRTIAPGQTFRRPSEDDLSWWQKVKEGIRNGASRVAAAHKSQSPPVSDSPK